MSGRWFVVDGRMVQLHGDHDDIIEQQRELVSDGHTVKAARRPSTITSRDLASKASQHRRRR
jgi:hypothetical protein